MARPSSAVLGLLVARACALQPRYDAAPLRYFAPCARGLEGVLAAELRGPFIGAAVVEEGSAGVSFDGPDGVHLRAALESRTANRVHEVLGFYRGVRHADDLYAAARDVDWRRHLEPDATLRVETTLGARVPQGLDHSHFSSLTLKNAIVDGFRESNRLGARPSVGSPEEVDAPLALYLHDGCATIYRSLTRDSLHRRGYRAEVHKAALRPTIAAGVLHLAGWPAKGGVLCDPMCGSGTLAIEAAMMARKIAPGLIRAGAWPPGGESRSNRFCGPRWADWDPDAWGATVDVALGRVEASCPGPILASDTHPGALTLAEAAAARAGVAADVAFSKADAGRLSPEPRPTLVVSNPPWDGRLDGGEAAWEAMRDFLKREVGGGTAYLLSGNMPLTQTLRLRATSKRKLVSGGVDLRFLEYHLRGGRPSAAADAADASRADYAGRTVVDLKALLRTRGLKLAGKKADLVARLLDADRNPAAVTGEEDFARAVRARARAASDPAPSGWG